MNRPNSRSRARKGDRPVAQDDNVALNKRVVLNARVECSVQHDSYAWQGRRILNYHQESALHVRTAPTNGRRSPVGSHHIEVRLADREVFVRLVLLDRPTRPDASLPCRPTARQGVSSNGCYPKPTSTAHPPSRGSPAARSPAHPIRLALAGTYESPCPVPSERSGTS